MMQHSFEEISDSSRLWVYQSNRPFTTGEVEKIEAVLSGFVQTWAAHGQGLKAAFSVLHQQFIILAVDESFRQASGCSIDDSVGVIRQLEQDFQVQLLDRSQVAFMVRGKVQLFPMREIKSKIQTGEIEKDSRIFNNFVDSLGDFKSSWLQPVEESWVSRYFA